MEGAEIVAAFLFVVTARMAMVDMDENRRLKLKEDIERAVCHLLPAACPISTKPTPPPHPAVVWTM